MYNSTRTMRTLSTCACSCVARITFHHQITFKWYNFNQVHLRVMCFIFQVRSTTLEECLADLYPRYVPTDDFIRTLDFLIEQLLYYKDNNTKHDGKD